MVERGRCFVCRKVENGENSPCAERNRKGKILPVLRGRKWESIRLFREEENEKDAPCAEKRMGIIPPLQERIE